MIRPFSALLKRKGAGRKKARRGIIGGDPRSGVAAVYAAKARFFTSRGRQPLP
jgi:hypothetical protein